MFIHKKLQKRELYELGISRFRRGEAEEPLESFAAAKSVAARPNVKPCRGEDKTFATVKYAAGKCIL